ncbi:unnamed protein product [Brachionus calyciflorus]|uniref:RING-type domain-containing protein n=1 Tax=Brachionus calyciflorus TaxID=104777 RepID=A0A814NP38_9BILA|nr:unnamed protein product [Brachionus calyciflorus]
MLLSEESLMCSFCKKTFREPRILPCGDSLCFKCIKIENNKLQCMFCNQTHHVPLNGFPINKALLKSLDSIFFSDDIKSKLADYETKLKSIKNESEKIKSISNSPETEVINHCRNLVNKIDLTFETKFQEMSSIRFDLIKRILDYEKKCIEKLSDKKEQLNESMEKMNFLYEQMRQSCKKILTSDQENSMSELNNYEILKSKVKMYEKQFFNLIYEDKTIEFDINEENVDTNFIGELKIKDESLLKISDFKQKDFLKKYMYNNSIKLLRIGDDKTLLSFTVSHTRTYARSSRNFHELNLILFKNENILTKVGTEIGMCSNSYLIKYHERFFYILLQDPRRMNKLDENLKTVANFELHDSIRDFLISKNFLICVTNYHESSFNFYDLEKSGNLIIKINPSWNFFRYMPKNIKSCYATDLFYFLKSDDSLCILSQADGKLVKKIEMDMNYEIIKITQDNLIVIQDKLSIIYMDLDGNIWNKHILEGFPDNIKLMLDEENKLEFFDPEDLIIYF